MDDRLIEPRRSALVVVDLQNDFVHPDGYFGSHGKDVSAAYELVPRVASFVEAVRQAGALVVWIRQSTLPNGRSDSPAWRAFKQRHGFDGQYTLAGSWGQALCEPLEPAPDEPVVEKFRSSAFRGTSLDAILRANGVEHVFVCGCMTEGCVESTVRDAAFHDFYAGVVRDMVASTVPKLHEASLLVMSSQFRVVESAELLARWRGGV